MQHGWLIALLVIAGAIIINTLGDNVLTPRLAGKALNMSLATIFLAFIFWAWVFGLLGALMSIPLTPSSWWRWTATTKRVGWPT